MSTGRTYRRRCCALEALEPRTLLSLTIDLRLPGGGKTAMVDEVGDVVTMDVYAVVSDNNPAAPEAFQMFMGSFLSSNPGGTGSTRGNLLVDLISSFNAAGSADSYSPSYNPPYSSPAGAIDLDLDGDLDVGSNDDSSAWQFVFAKAGSMRSLSTVPKEVKVGTLQYTVTQLRSGATTEINFRRRNGIQGGLWYEDGILQTGTSGSILAGAPIVIQRAADVLPPTLVRGYYAPDHPGLIMHISEEFQTGISASLLQVKNLATQQIYIPSAVSFAQGLADPLAIRWTISPRLPQGSYRATLPAGTVKDLGGRTHSTPFIVDFVVRNGDANGDGIVNIDDYFAIDTGYARRASIAAPTYAQGDFNFDNVIDSADYFVIDAGFLGGAPLAVSTPALIDVFSSMPNGEDGVLDEAGRILLK